MLLERLAEVKDHCRYMVYGDGAASNILDAQL